MSAPPIETVDEDGGIPLWKAIEATTGRWMKWGVSAEMAADIDIPKGITYLIALVTTRASRPIPTPAERQKSAWPSYWVRRG